MGNSAACTEVARGCGVCQNTVPAGRQQANSSTSVYTVPPPQAAPRPANNGFAMVGPGAPGAFDQAQRVPPSIVGSAGAVESEPAVKAEPVAPMSDALFAMEAGQRVKGDPTTAGAAEATDSGATGSKGTGMSAGMKEALSNSAAANQRYELPDGWLGSDVKNALRTDGGTTGASEFTSAGVGDEPEPAPEGPADGDGEEEPTYDACRELKKALLSVAFVIIFWVVLFLIARSEQASYNEPTCPSGEEDEDVTVTAEPIKLCEPCGDGTIFLPLFGNWELSLNRFARAPFYFIGLMWTFLGIGIVCDQFMGAIEVITSAQRDVWMDVRSGTKHKFRMKVWNTTVANLTLMALGSSAPEILLSVIEIMSADYFAGELGPSTIVGSAAFNLLIITAVCVSALPAGETRHIACTDVFIVTASSSIFAYFWMLVMLRFITPDLVERWEAVCTFLMFPVLCILAFMADKGWMAPIFQCGRRRPGGIIATLDVDSAVEKLKAKYGKELPSHTVTALLELEALKNLPDAAAKAAIRKNITASAAGKGQSGAVTNGDSTMEPTFGFAEPNYTVLECVGSVSVTVQASRAYAFPVTVQYRTQAGTARDGVRYKHVEGMVRFLPNQTERVIEIPIIDDDSWQDDEYFTVILSDISVQAGASPRKAAVKAAASPRKADGSRSEVVDPRLGLDTTTITVLNDDIPGTLDFDSDETYCKEGSIVQVGVVRTHGTSGRIEVQYETKSGSAIDGRDFKHTQGTLVFQDGEAHRTIDVQILANSAAFNFEGNERFQLLLSDPSPGVKFDEKTDGGETNAVCDVIILSRKNPPLYGRLMAVFFNQDQAAENLSAWWQQYVDAMYCGGSPEEQVVASYKDWFFHVLSLTWKVFFAIVPPPNIAGGWACFVGALGCIGLVTALVGDMANLLGCCLDIPNDITAITLVALGTSLPDTFASMVAAQQDDTADNSVGNVTGSNSVNVFLGLGLPWTVAAFYWVDQGRTPEWNRHKYKGERYDAKYGSTHPDGGFMMPAGSLSFSVTVFTVCALACLLLLVWRRFKYGGELGGPYFAQRRDSLIMASLWLVYVGLSIYDSLSRG